jgi:hypothetical protein
MSQPSSLQISDGTRWRPARTLPRRDIGGDTVLVDSRARRIHATNKVGGVVWAGVERGATLAEIVSDVVARFRVSAEQARADVAAFFGELEAAGLVEKQT